MSAEVERIMGLVIEHGAARYDAGFASASGGRSFAVRRLETEADGIKTELRSALLAVVPGWLPVSSYPNDCRAVLAKWAPIMGISDAGFVYAVTRKLGNEWIDPRDPDQIYCEPDAIMELEGATEYVPTWELGTTPPESGCEQ